MTKRIYVQQTPAATNPLATTALILGICGVVLFWTVWLGIILGVLAIIFGHRALQDEERRPEHPRDPAC